MSFFGVELNAQLNRLYLEIRLKLSQNKLIPNFRTIYRSFAKIDPNITGVVSLTDFDKVSHDLIFSLYNKIKYFSKSINYKFSKKHTKIKLALSIGLDLWGI